jgi:zinc protease
MRAIAAALAALTLAAPAAGQLAAPQGVQAAPIAPEASTFTLPNGLQVVVIPDRRIAVVTHMIWYRAGAADEPAGRSGIAHFLEHLLFKGTERFPANTFSRRLASFGGQENAFTSWDYTAYFQRTTREQLPLLMDFESDRMMNLRLTDEVVLPERDVVLEERRQVVDNNPASQFSEQLGAALFQNHPYRIPIIGWEHEIRRLDRADAFAFYERFYSPNNAIVIIAGDVTEAEVRDLAERTYARVPVRVPTIVRERPQEPQARAARRIAMLDPRVQQPSWSRVYLAPSYRTAQPGEAEAFEVLGQILGGQTGRVYRALVVEQQLAATASGGYSGTALDSGRFSLAANPRPGVALERIEAGMDAVLAAVVERGVTQEEVDRAVNSLIASAVYSQDSSASLARIFGAGLTTGGTIEDVRQWPLRIARVTVEQVNAAARRLDIRASVTGTLARGEPARRS